MKPHETSRNQQVLPLRFGMQRGPRNAPRHIVGQCASPAQALAVSILAGRHKLDHIAAIVGKSRSYISRLQTGSAPIPDRLIGPLCAATGFNLLRQYVDLERALSAPRPEQYLAAQLAEAA